MRWNTVRHSVTGRVALGDNAITLCESDMRCLGFTDEDLRHDIPFELTVEKDPKGNMWLRPHQNGMYELANRRNGRLFMNDYILLDKPDLEPLGLRPTDVGKRFKVEAVRMGNTAYICCHDILWWFEGLDIRELDDASEASIMESIVDNRPSGKLYKEVDGKTYEGYWTIKDR